MPKILPGETTVAGFRVREPLGSGGMGAVYLAEDEQGTRAALKVLTVHEERARARFLREVRLGKELRHPNVVRVHEGGEFGDSLFLVMELVEGKDLARIRRERERLGPGDCLQVLRQLAAGLDAIHERGLVHRDLKPENVMIRKDGVLKIMDLGLAWDPDATQLTKTGSLVGTPWFMAPEQVRGAKVTPSTDLFAAGLILYCLLTGRHPFRRRGERDFLRYLGRLSDSAPRPWHPQGVDGPLDRFFRRALASDPGERYPTAGALAQAFAEALEGQARGDLSVERTLERTVEDSGVGSLEDLRTPESSPSGSAPGAAPSPMAEGAPSPRRRWIGPAVAVLPLFLLALLWGGLAPGEVVLHEVEGFALEEGHVVAVRAEGGGALRLAGREPSARAEAEGLLLFEVPELPEVLRLERSRGSPVFAQEAAGVDWRLPRIRERRFDADGDLVLRIERPPLGRVGLRRSSGSSVADSTPTKETARFRVAPTGGGRVEALEVVLALAGRTLTWSRLPESPDADRSLEAFLDDLETYDPVAAMRAAGRGPGAAHRLLRDLRGRGLVEGFELLRERLGPAVREGGPRARRLVAQASKLFLLDGYLATSGIPEAGALPVGEVEDFAGPLRDFGFFVGRPPPGPGRLVFPVDRNYYELTDAPLVDADRSLTGLMMTRFEGAAVPPLPRVPRPAWIGLYTYEWRGGFFAEVWLDDRGPFYLVEDPRADRRRAFEAAGITGEKADPERRLYWLRLPEGAVQRENRLRMVLRPHMHREEVTRPFAILDALVIQGSP